MAWFKLHRLPFPSARLAATATEGGGAALSWINGPKGAGTAITTHVEYYELKTTAALTAMTVAGTAATTNLSGLAGPTVNTYRVRLRRQNASGYGQWTPYASVSIAAVTA
jgi:hypothetical protein